MDGLHHAPDPVARRAAALSKAKKPVAFNPLWLILPLIAVAVITCGLAIGFWSDLTDPANNPTALVYEAVLSLFMSFLPALLCVVQNASKRRQQNRLAVLEGFPVEKTVSYRTAISSIESIQDMTVGSDYFFPLLVMFLTVFIGAFGFLIGYNFPQFFVVPNMLLGGIGHANPDDAATVSGMVGYQRETFVVIGIAFFAAYINALGMLLNRVNNNDLYPISLHYHVIRIVIGCIAAAVLRHTASVYDTGQSHAFLVIMAFAVGFAPDLFVLTIIRRGFQVLKIWGARDDPGVAARPDSMPLLMIDDLTRDKVDRLNELGIDSVQVLARQNPFLLLPRLPYELAMIVDWISQAQLYALVRDVRMKALRDILVRDVFDLHLRLSDATTQAATIAALGISADTAAAVVRQLEADPSFLRVRQVREAMASLGPIP